MSPLRVLFLIHHLRTGGAEQFTATLLPELQRTAQIAPSIAVLDTPGDLEPAVESKGIILHRFRKGAGPTPPWMIRLARRLNARDVDILQMQGSSAALWGCLLTAANPDIIRVVSYHTIQGWHRPRKRWLANRLYQRLVHRYVAVCEAEKRTLVDRYGISPVAIAVIPNCVDSAFYCPGAPAPDVKRQLGLPVDRPIAGVVGRCSPEKGGDIFIRAMAMLRHSRVDIHGVLAGDGPARPALENLATELGVNDRVTFAGRVAQERMPDTIRCFDIGVVPSHQECCSVAILEQMACGIPVVATNTGGNAELVDHGGTGTIVPPGDPSALAGAIRRLLQSPGDRRRYGQAARRRIEAHFTIRAVTDQYVSLYKSLNRRRSR